MIEAVSWSRMDSTTRVARLAALFSAAVDGTYCADDESGIATREMLGDGASFPDVRRPLEVSLAETREGADRPLEETRFKPGDEVTGASDDEVNDLGGNPGESGIDAPELVKRTELVLSFKSPRELITFCKI